MAKSCFELYYTTLQNEFLPHVCLNTSFVKSMLRKYKKLSINEMIDENFTHILAGYLLYIKQC